VERFADARLAHRFAESRKVVRKQGAVPIQQAHREEKGPARDPVVAVMCHVRSLPSGAAMPCRSGANAHELKSLNHNDSTHDVTLTTIHFRALNRVADVASVTF
jgi:hypothetical protein